MCMDQVIEGVFYLAPHSSQLFFLIHFYSECLWFCTFNIMKRNVLTGQQLIIAGFVSYKSAESFAHLAHIYHQCIAVYRC